MTCKDCVHYEACKNILVKAFPKTTETEIEAVCSREGGCAKFKPKSRFVELPCEVGDYLLWDNGKEVVLKKVKGFRYDPLDLGLRFIIDCCTPVLGCDAIKPTADVVEVVRCKDCKHRVKHSNMCAHPKAVGWDAIEPEDDDFCSYGEKALKERERE